MNHPHPSDEAASGGNSESAADQQLSQLLRQHLQRHEPGAGLRAGIRAQVALRAASDKTATSMRIHTGPLLAWRSAAAGLVCGVALTLAVGLLLQQPLVSEAGLEAALVDSHVHALGTGPLFQVASSDRHTVKPWFQGKLDFSPPVPDLTAMGYPLLGGRQESLQGHNVAALVYEHHKHMVNVYIWPDDKTRAPEMLTRKGFHLNHWSEGGMQVWVVTDADATELAHFTQAWRDAVTLL